MSEAKYTVAQYSIGSLISWVNDDTIAIPEIQRPFVWDATKVRNLLDSLYQGYPIGYLIAWKNPNVRLKDGTYSEGKKILIDGQQRVTALMTAVLGRKVITKDYRHTRICIAFNPVTETFEVSNPAIQKDQEWIQDVGPIISGQVKLIATVRKYCEKNPDIQEEKVEDAIDRLGNLGNRQIGMIELAANLEIETVTEIFIRINSAGVVLSQADFAMSKMAANERYGGHTLRKAIDYFCHLAVAPEFYPTVAEVDQDFAKTDYFKAMSWLKNENDDLYDPSYTDMLRVAFTSQFGRGRFSDLVSLLSGRNFETKEFEDSIAEASFAKLSDGVMKFMNKTQFQCYVMILRSAGFIDSGLVRSQNVLNMGYILYLALRDAGVPPQKIESLVRRWVVLSILTGRYSGSAESQFDYDIKRITAKPFSEYLAEIEEAELSDAFWEAGLVQALNTSVASSPLINIFWAAQVKGNERGFLSRDITVDAMISHHGDIHHIFPRAYMKKNGLKRGQYNQIANFAYTQTEINIAIGSRPPSEYMQYVRDSHCAGEKAKYGGIVTVDDLMANLAANCIPNTIFDMDIDDYDTFLGERRKLMAAKMRKYYDGL